MLGQKPSVSSNICTTNHQHALVVPVYLFHTDRFRRHLFAPAVSVYSYTTTSNATQSTVVWYLYWWAHHTSGIPPWRSFTIPRTAACALLLNEVFIPNGPLCQLTCANLFQCCFIPDGPAWQSCHCMPGTARSRRGDCIPVASQECINEIRDRSVVCRIWSGARQMWDRGTGLVSDVGVDKCLLGLHK